uniref:Reverse transcriptase domain-containing protein n=1 Tax=Tanacetum cinerariifolium TaxID=118510 RepID=A0A6L2M9N0_TANCI|nr:hypothetical protein [Tanacetum cinerariifolium]
MKLSSVNRWTKILIFPYAQPEDSNELFQKLLEDLHIIKKELTKCNRPTFFDNNEDHSFQNKEYSENSSNEIAASNSNQEKEGPPKDFDIRQLIREECGIEVCEEQKQNMEELVEICRQKEILCMHDNVDDLIESALNSNLLSINSQRLNKEKQEVKNIMKQPAEHRTRIIESLQNFRVIHKSSISLNNTSQISPVYATAPILSTKEPEYSPSMEYEHVSTTPKTELDKVTESSAKNLLPIQVNASDDESLSEEDVLIEESKVYSNLLFDDDEINSDELESHVESNFDALIDSSQKIDYLEEFSGELAHINPEITKSNFDFEEEIRLIENLIYDNSSPRPPEELNAEVVDTIIESLSLLPIPVLDGKSQREEIDIVTETDDVLPPSVENDDDSEEDIHFLEELLSDNSISLTEDESSDSDHQDDSSVLRPPPEPPDA